MPEAAAEEVEKYQHLKNQFQELTNASTIKFTGFPLGASGKWHQGNYKLLAGLALFSSLQEKVAHCL